MSKCSSNFKTTSKSCQKMTEICSLSGQKWVEPKIIIDKKSEIVNSNVKFSIKLFKNFRFSLFLVAVCVSLNIVIFGF